MTKFDKLVSKVIGENQLSPAAETMAKRDPNAATAYDSRLQNSQQSFTPGRKMPVSDDYAAKIIADKILPYALDAKNIQTLKQLVSKYLGMVGKNTSDLDLVTADVLDILQTKGVLTDLR